MNPKVVVLTPTRNEAWIIERFLETTSQWADLIIVADQGSDDGTREICDRYYPKVRVIENESLAYNEAERQELLIRAARDLALGRRILLALDADEILAADARASDGWGEMLGAEDGTVLCFEKPDLCSGLRECVRFATPWPLGYVDDGAEFVPRRIHSIRIPTPEGARQLSIDDVKILHFALVREGAQEAKSRFYAVQENLLGTSPLYRRRIAYSAKRDWRANGGVGPLPRSWLEGWETQGIDLHSFQREAFYWHDFEVLRAFALYGTRRFWLEDIWSFDWEGCRRFGLEGGLGGLPQQPVKVPPGVARIVSHVVDLLYWAWSRTIARWRNRAG